MRVQAGKLFTAAGFSLPWSILGLLGLALLGLFAIGFDQGQLLAPFLGKLSYQLNLLHEVAHDARHAAAFPCH
ncbi:MAG TPA: CbtB-domain containing protein [Herpetosiphonaceae bacterium]|nr:CbtB-domain containing protein [Actinomycetota bacterium]HSH80324.1 CbtB-domain containing protein [Herpetosiphonaceae bacterium]